MLGCRGHGLYPEDYNVEYQRLISNLLDRDLGIERYLTYIVTKSVKEEIVLPVGDLLSGELPDGE